ncbi:MAG: hypothetical protein IJ043_07750 [Clostridia bacterium]|nr:hypothetical protein [Clostridia bacterium]
MKLKNEPVFIAATLCLFFPIGLFFLLRSELKGKSKCFIGICGGMIFLALLSPALLNRPKPVDPADFHLIVTRPTLSVGQSGGFIITNGKEYYTDFTAETENNLIKVHNNLYTAVQPGICTLKVTFEDEVRTVTLEVADGPGTDTLVLTSPSGERYHLTTAKHAGKRAVEMTEEEALRSGKSPCKTCYQ